ncbi:polyribonucleotide 5'-hydroxyl-kinase [Nematocida displodere]|uniref:Polynucleotide 5'-hydroxyl-kinase GRC3 n=1 Tax=Nematocida displodere TaxID=1805483 RepID=A0A177EDJ9_9MICR|nr:polyribonucleotide 5'-hydroxyl-kinase [Nematocida displodere]
MDVELKPGCELRIEVPTNGKVKFVVSENTAESNGQELLLGKWYTVKEELFFIFTYTGCKVKLAASEAFSYVSEDSTVPYIFNVFSNLIHTEKKRLLIVGEGRTTLANTLTNYFVRGGEKVLQIDLDVHGGSLLFPGTMTMTVIDEVYSQVEPLSTSEKLSYFFGSPSASDNTDLYSLLLQETLAVAKQKDFTGPSVVIGHKQITKEEIEKTMQAYSIDYLLVIGDEKLYNQVSTDQKIHLPRFPGLIPRDTERRRQQISSRIKRYFYGEHEEYSPSTLTINIGERSEKEGAYRVVQVGDEFMAPMSALPLGSSKRKNSTSVTECLPTAGSVLAISSAETLEEVSTSPVVGFLTILEVISETQLKVLSPQPKVPQRPFLIQGKIRLLG